MLDILKAKAAAIQLQFSTSQKNTVELKAKLEEITNQLQAEQVVMSELRGAYRLLEELIKEAGETKETGPQV